MSNPIALWYTNRVATCGKDHDCTWKTLNIVQDIPTQEIKDPREQRYLFDFPFFDKGSEAYRDLLNPKRHESIFSRAEPNSPYTNQWQNFIEGGESYWVFNAVMRTCIVNPPLLDAIFREILEIPEGVNTSRRIFDSEARKMPQYFHLYLHRWMEMREDMDYVRYPSYIYSTCEQHVQTNK